MKTLLRLLLCLSFLAPLQAEDDSLKKLIEHLKKNAAQMEEMAADEGTIEILSLYPSALSKPPAGDKPADPQPKFHSYPILGRTKVTDPKVKKELLMELAKSIRASIPEDGGISVALCFNPRHGIIYTKGEKKLEFLICFECEQVHPYDGEKRVPGFAVKSTIGPEVFDAFLDKHHIKRSEL
jgi:hypothetical protein